MNELQAKIWAPYINLIGAENFKIHKILVKSKHYSGFDLSQQVNAEQYAAGQVQQIIARYAEYKDIINKSALNVSDISLIFDGLVAKDFIDSELVYLINNKTLEVSNKEWWDLIKSLWTRQEFNSIGSRKNNWIEIFKYKERTRALTSGLPSKFTAYRAGNDDGFSWTLDERVAQWFHNRFKSEFGDIPFLEREFSKADVVFYTNSRQEKEVVIIPRK